jgi:hypothetical protein
MKRASSGLGLWFCWSAASNGSLQDRRNNWSDPPQWILHNSAIWHANHRMAKNLSTELVYELAKLGWISCLIHNSSHCSLLDPFGTALEIREVRTWAQTWQIAPECPESLDGTERGKRLNFTSHEIQQLTCLLEASHIFEAFWSALWHVSAAAQQFNSV